MKSLPTVCNIKFRINLQCKIVSPPLTNIKIYHNFEVIRLPSFTLIIFNEKGRVNITGVKNFKKINKCLQLFNHIFSQYITADSIVIDNSTSSGNILFSNFNVKNKTRINLVKLKFFCNKKFGSDVKISLHPDFFPGAVIRRKSNSTVVLFTTGKYIIVGAKSEEEIEKSFNSLCAIIQNYWTI